MYPLAWLFYRGWVCFVNHLDQHLELSYTLVSVLQQGMVQGSACRLACPAWLLLGRCLQPNLEACLGTGFFTGAVSGWGILFSHLFFSWALSLVFLGGVRCPWWAPCCAWCQLHHGQSPWKGKGATSSVPGASGELRPSTAERRSNNFPFPPPSPPPRPFSFQWFHRILWLVAKSCPQGHSAAMGPSSWPADCASSWPTAEQIAQGCSW